VLIFQPKYLGLRDMQLVTRKEKHCLAFTLQHDSNSSKEVLLEFDDLKVLQHIHNQLKSLLDDGIQIANSQIMCAPPETSSPSSGTPKLKKKAHSHKTLVVPSRPSREKRKSITSSEDLQKELAKLEDEENALAKSHKSAEKLVAELHPERADATLKEKTVTFAPNRKEDDANKQEKPLKHHHEAPVEIKKQDKESHDSDTKVVVDEKEKNKDAKVEHKKHHKKGSEEKAKHKKTKESEHAGKHGMRNRLSRLNPLRLLKKHKKDKTND